MASESAYVISVDNFGDVQGKLKGFSGLIPDTIGNLKLLTILSLNNNSFNGPIPASIGSLSQLFWLDLANNQLEGHLPVSNATAPGLDMLLHAKHFRFDRNSITGPVPSNLNNLVYVSQLYLSNNNLSGPIPNLTGMNSLNYFGTLVFRATSISDLRDSVYYTKLEASLMQSFEKLPVNSVFLSNPFKDVSEDFKITLQIFPSGQGCFNRTGLSQAGLMFSNQSFKPPDGFGPYYFLADLVPSDCYAGARGFSFEELKKYTNKFSEENSIGSGGYGKVYWGTLLTGQPIAIKRAQKESLQGGHEFKTEIELLSRVHHKNLVSLVGFCFDQGEQMLVYEYVPNGTLKDSLSGKSRIKLDWMRRLKVALGAARGLAYLHELVNPPIIHRDIKSTNILLDERINAKVADFGLSIPMGDDERDHVTTQVKGTMGYLDLEYYMTQQLTEKSDVYSYGVVMLELVTARMPIERGKYIVKVVQMEMDKTKVLYNLHDILDPAIGLQTSLKGLEKFVDLAMRCVEDSGANRPAMGDVVKEIENIMQIAGLNPNAESTSASDSYEVSKGNSGHPYYNETFEFEYSGAFPTSKIEPH
nr:putative leucine-rich repeat receptor-like protein kinase [Quercus suber]